MTCVSDQRLGRAQFQIKLAQVKMSRPVPSTANGIAGTFRLLRVLRLSCLSLLLPPALSPPDRSSLQESDQSRIYCPLRHRTAGIHVSQRIGRARAGRRRTTRPVANDHRRGRPVQPGGLARHDQSIQPVAIEQRFYGSTLTSAFNASAATTRVYSPLTANRFTIKSPSFPVRLSATTSLCALV